MATPSSPIGFGRIYSEANGLSPSSQTSFADLAQTSYFSGPGGSNTIAYNAWGQAQGINGIFAVQGLSANPNKFSSFRNVSYFYDQTQYSSLWRIDNNCAAFPDYDFNYLFEFKDSSLTYSYCTNGGLINGATSTGFFEATNPTTPLIYGCNWYLQVDTGPQYTGDASVTLTINNNLIMNKEPMANTGPYTEMFDYTTYGNEYMTVGQPSGVITGSRVEITFQT